jgi:O-glycosyl hydrolase
MEPRGVKIVFPEKQWWADDLARETLEDPVTRDMVYAVAAHGYLYDEGADPDRPLTMANKYNKETWQTEVCGLGEGCNTSIENGLGWGRHIHRLLANSHVSAWLWWQCSTNKPISNGETLICPDTRQPRKLLFVMGNWSKFVRPGWVCIGTEGSTFELLVTAFKNIETGRFAVVVLNTEPYPVQLEVSFNGFEAGNVTPWVTSASKNLENGTDIPAGNSFIATVDSLSATTFIGNGPEQAIVSKPVRKKAVPSHEATIHLCGNILSIPASFGNKPLTVYIYATDGSLARKMVLPGIKQTSHVDLQSLSSGVYSIKMQSGQVIVSGTAALLK